MAALFKFRCSGCQKLLGVSPRKVGSVVDCPRCGAELIVPPVDDDLPVDEGDDAPIQLEDLGLRLDRPPSPVGPKSADPVAFLERGEPSEEPEVPPDLPDEFESPDAPLAPRPPGRRRVARPAARSRDVVLPRTAAVAWSLFALLALGSAFGAGMMVGHYLWR